MLGYNLESLEFVQALKESFPDIKVTVIDTKNESTIEEKFGKDIEKEISKEFTSRGVDFFIKVSEDLMFSNKFSFKNVLKR